jgi:ribose 5-phosphate isomerase A
MEFVQAGMRLGLGTGSTAERFIRLLGERVRAGLDVACVPSSDATEALARELGIPLLDWTDGATLDMTVDGADEVDPGLRLIKGGGAALVREKIVAAASRQMTVIVDESKIVPWLGAFPLPVAIIPFGRERTLLRLNGFAPATLRTSDGRPVVTDDGLMVADLAFGDQIQDPEGLDAALLATPGVAATGLFLGIATRAVVGFADGSARVIERNGHAHRGANGEP